MSDGIKVEKKKAVNEVAERAEQFKNEENAPKKETAIQKFQREQREKEVSKVEAKSSDREILQNVTPEQLKQLQAEFRLVQWDSKTREALVLKVEFSKKFQLEKEKRMQAAKNK